MRVATLNLWCRHGSWPDRRRVLIDGFRELRPDLVAFQESIRTSEYDQVADLLGPAYTVFHQAGRTPHDGAGASIASRWPLRHAHELDLTVDRQRRCGRSRGTGPGRAGSLRQPQAVLAVRLGVRARTAGRGDRAAGGGTGRAQPATRRAGRRPRRRARRGQRPVLVRAAVSGQHERLLPGCTHPGEPGHTLTPRDPLVNTGEMTMELGRADRHLNTMDPTKRP
jgi:hypothetical protein